MGDFVFVRPGGGETADNCYEGERPTYKFSQSGWEWLMERVLRRELILAYFASDNALLALSARCGLYRLSRWPAFQNTESASYGRNSSFRDSNWEAPASADHDGALLDATSRPIILPSHAGNSTGTFTDWWRGPLKVLNSLLRATSDHQLGANYFLAPDWTPPAKFRTTASLSAKTEGTSSDYYNWTWTATASMAPYQIPDAAFFRLLGDARPDDPAETVTFSDDAGSEREVTLPPVVRFVIGEDALTAKWDLKILDEGYVNGSVNTDEILSYWVKPDMPVSPEPEEQGAGEGGEEGEGQEGEGGEEGGGQEGEGGEEGGGQEGEGGEEGEGQEGEGGEEGGGQEGEGGEEGHEGGMPYSGTFSGTWAYPGVSNLIEYLGALHDHVARTPGSPIYVKTDVQGHPGWGRVQPDISWPTDAESGFRTCSWWHANGFPKGLESVMSARLRGQLEALSVTQPSIPPVLPLLGSLPGNGFDAVAHYGSNGRYLYIYGMGAADFDSWPGANLALAATPYCAGKMLDAMTKTVHRVGGLCAEMDAHRLYTTKRWPTGTGSALGSAGYRTEEEETAEGDVYVANVLNAGGWHSPEPSAGWTRETVSGSSRTYDGTTVYDYVDHREEAVAGLRCTLKGPIAVRSTKIDDPAPRYTTTTTQYTSKDGQDVEEGYPRTAVSGTKVTGGPAEPRKLFPDWLLPWIEKAELFLAYETTLSDSQPYESSYTWTEFDPASGPATSTPSGMTGSGESNCSSAKGVVSLGVMDLATGKFPDIDVIELRGLTDPEVQNNAAYSPYSSNTSHTEEITHAEAAGGGTDTTTVTMHTTKFLPQAALTRRSELYVVVDWKFDARGMQPFGQRLQEIDAEIAAVDALADAQSAEDDARAAEGAARANKEARERELAAALAALDGADDASRPGLQAEADRAAAALERDSLAYEEAQQAYEEAQQAYEEAAQALDDARTAAGNAISSYSGRLR